MWLPITVVTHCLKEHRTLTFSLRAARRATMAFDRKDYGMNSGIPFIRIANRVEVTFALKAKRVSGPPLVFKH